MGCGLSIARFECNDEIPGQDKACMRVFKALNLSPRDINKFYTAFKDIDADERCILLVFGFIQLI